MLERERMDGSVDARLTDEKIMVDDWYMILGQLDVCHELARIRPNEHLHADCIPNYDESVYNYPVLTH